MSSHVLQRILFSAGRTVGLRTIWYFMAKFQKLKPYSQQGGGGGSSDCYVHHQGLDRFSSRKLCVHQRVQACRPAPCHTMTFRNKASAIWKSCFWKRKPHQTHFPQKYMEFDFLVLHEVAISWLEMVIYRERKDSSPFWINIKIYFTPLI